MYLQINIQQAHFMEVLVLKNLHVAENTSFPAKRYILLLMVCRTWGILH